MRKKVRRIIKIGSVLTLITFFLVFLSDNVVRKNTQPHVYNKVDDIPNNKVGLLLGTGKFLQNGLVNLYYAYRIEAAVELFNAGKIQYILVSGDNSRKDYDEPTTIMEDLINKGIPEDKIVLDYAGFRTLDSVVRSKEIFGQKSITVISQPFHNERAIFIAGKKGINAVGFNARDVSTRYGIKVQIREKLARVKMMLDLLFGKGPRFLGEQIAIGEGVLIGN